MATPNQHYISRVLLKRFKLPGEPLQCYQVDSGEWIPKSIDRACAAPGYNQLILPDGVENTLEEEFSKVESGLPKTFRTLEAAANSPSANLTEAEFANLCRYCAVLKMGSLFSKGAAVVNFVLQLNSELEHGRTDSLRELQIPERGIEQLQREVAQGRRIIIESENPMQMLYRRHFCLFHLDISEFYHTKWRVLKSPIELPISDIGLFPLHLEDSRVNRSVLPIGPYLILEGTFFYDQSKNAPHQPVKGMRLSESDAQGYFDYLCASAITELIFTRKCSGILEAIKRCEADGISFQRLAKIDDIKSAGERNSSQAFEIRLVSVEEYKTFVHARLKPRKPSFGN